MTDWKFEKKTYNGIEIIVETNTGYVNASQMCSSNNKRWREYKRTNAWKEIIEIYDEFIKNTCESKIFQGVNFPTPYFDIKITRDFQGCYIHPKLVHLVAEYCSKRYAFMVAELMDSINETVHAKLAKDNLKDTPANSINITEETFKYMQDVCIKYNMLINEREEAAKFANKHDIYCWGIRD